jgi:hypothetical protein
MDYMKTTDPLLKESMRGLLGTWGRVVVSSECFDNLWRVLEGAGGNWEIDIAGEIRRVERCVDFITISRKEYRHYKYPGQMIQAFHCSLQRTFVEQRRPESSILTPIY